jgi:hypothetical protein
MMPAPGAAVLDASVRGSALQHNAAARGTGARQLPSESAPPAHSPHGMPPQPADALPVDVDLSKPILKQVLLSGVAPEPSKWPQQAVWGATNAVAPTCRLHGALTR